MSEEQIQRFIFAPGFSTATTISSVSGRGVGMDVVKTNIEKIGGTIDLKSTQGKGTMFTIKIPLTLAIVSALIVEASGERFAIPQISVVELVRARHGSDKGQNAANESVIERINDTPVLRLRNHLLPLVSLAELLELGTGTPTEGGADVVVAQVGTQMMGIIVDRVFDTEEIVVKPVAPILRHVTMFSGNTILGDGSVIMILDPNGIARRHRAWPPDRMPVPSTSQALSRRTGSHAKSSMRQRNPPCCCSGPAASQRDGGAAGPGRQARGHVRACHDRDGLAGAPVTQYRGKLMPLDLDSSAHALTCEAAEHSPCWCSADSEGGAGQERRMGLMVDEIIDVVDDHGWKSSLAMRQCPDCWEVP